MHQMKNKIRIRTDDQLKLSVPSHYTVLACYLI